MHFGLGLLRLTPQAFWKLTVTEFMALGGAFLTIQKAIDTVGMLDLSIYDVTIQCGPNAAWGSFVKRAFAGEKFELTKLR